MSARREGFATAYAAQVVSDHYVSIKLPTGMTCVQLQMWVIGFEQGRALAWSHRMAYQSAMKEIPN